MPVYGTFLLRVENKPFIGPVCQNTADSDVSYGSPGALKARLILTPVFTRLVTEKPKKGPNIRIFSGVGYKKRANQTRFCFPWNGAVVHRDLFPLCPTPRRP
jgi:hypothetical protein